MFCLWHNHNHRRAQIKQALAYLTSPALEDFPVQFIVETQLLLDVYLKGRTRMHLLYGAPFSQCLEAECHVPFLSLVSVLCCCNSLASPSSCPFARYPTNKTGTKCAALTTQ